MTLDLVPISRLPAYIATNGIQGFCLFRMPNGRTVPAEVRKIEDEVFFSPYLDLAADPATVVNELARRCGLPVLVSEANSREEIAKYHSSRQHERTCNKRLFDEKPELKAKED